MIFRRHGEIIYRAAFLIYGGKRMKKVMALILLFAVSAAVVFILVCVNLFLVYSPLIVVAFSMTATVSFGISLLYGLLERKFSVSRKGFWIAAYLPVLVYAAVDLVKVCYETYVLHQMYLDPGAVLVFYDIPITCGAYGLFGTGWLVFCNVLAKRKAGK